MILECVLLALLSGGDECDCETTDRRAGVYDGMERVAVVVLHDKSAAIETEARIQVGELGLELGELPVTPLTGALIISVTCLDDCVVRVALMRTAWVGRLSRVRPYPVLLWSQLWVTRPKTVIKVARKGIRTWADDYKARTQRPES